jgi:hypothetical protein
VATIFCNDVVCSFFVAPANVGRLPPTRFTTVLQSTSTEKETSDELLRLLIQKAAAKPNEIETLNNEINPLVQSLIESRSSFDPSTSIDGQLFASIHFIGNTPLWEKIGSGAVRNVKGQKYDLNDQTFTNYAEIWGDSLCLKANGKLSEKGPVQVKLDSSSQADGNPFSAIASLFGSNNAGGRTKPTPFDYEARVTGASISIWNKFVLNLSIEGTGTVRVLYADENLRIFVSPTDTNVTKGGGDWESEGLIVVQVRVDLVYADWIDSL